jgi:hypothetical protein
MNRVIVNGNKLSRTDKNIIQEKIEQVLKSILTQNQTANVVVTIKES